MIMLFAGINYYPSGGWRDFKGYYKSIDDARKALTLVYKNYDWYQIVEDGGIVEEWME